MWDRNDFKFRRRIQSGISLLLLSLILVICSCQGKGKEKFPPPGAIEHAVDENGRLALTLYEDRIEFRNNGKVEETFDLVNFEGANFTPGGAILFFTGGGKRIIAYQDYGGAAAAKIVERVVHGG